MKVKNYIDNLYYVFFGSYFILCFVMSLLIIILHVNMVYGCLGVLFLVLTLTLVYFFYFRCYIFTKDSLVIKCGFIKRKIPYKEIKKGFITENNRLSYATSYKRICLKLKNKEIYISPVKMDEALLTIIKKTGGKKK